MEHKGFEAYFDIGLTLIGIVFIYKSVEFCVLRADLEAVVPSFIGYAPFLVISRAVIWGLTGICFIFNIASRLMGALTARIIAIILVTSTYRGFANGEALEYVALQFAFYFVLMGGAFMAASRGKWLFRETEVTKPESIEMYYAGRILTGCFFFTAGWLHLSHIDADAAILSGFPGARFWVILTGIAWICCALSFWLNILAKTATIGAILLVTVITFMINIRGIGHGNSWPQISQLFSNLSLIGSCLMISARGNYGLNTSRWWYPPQKWGFTYSKQEEGKK